MCSGSLMSVSGSISCCSGGGGLFLQEKSQPPAPLLSRRAPEAVCVCHCAYTAPLRCMCTGCAQCTGTRGTHARAQTRPRLMPLPGSGLPGPCPACLPSVTPSWGRWTQVPLGPGQGRGWIGSEITWVGRASVPRATDNIPRPWALLGDVEGPRGPGSGFTVGWCQRWLKSPGRQPGAALRTEEECSGSGSIPTWGVGL